MLEFSLPIGPFPWDRDTRRRRRDRIRELAMFLVCPMGYRNKNKTLFPPQGDVFVTTDKLTSTGIKVVSETSKKPGGQDRRQQQEAKPHKFPVPLAAGQPGPWKEIIP